MPATHSLYCYNCRSPLFRISGKRVLLTVPFEWLSIGQYNQLKHNRSWRFTQVTPPPRVKVCDRCHTKLRHAAALRSLRDGK